MPFDPFTEAGLVPTAPATTGFSGVIDVGGPTNIDPNAPAGAPGSGLIPSVVGGPETANPAPTPVSVSQTVNQMLEETAPAKAPEKAPAFDPFAAAGVAPATAAPTTAPPATTPTAEHQTILQPIKDAVQSVVKSLTTVPPYELGKTGIPTMQGSTGALQHGFTLGLDDILAPLIPAIAESVATGKPFAKVYDNVVQQMREPRVEFEKDHPYAAAALSTAGAVGSPPVFKPLFSATAPAIPLGKAVNAVRNVAAGTAAGAVTGGLMTDGGIDQRLEGVKEGAAAGGVLSTVAPLLVGGAQRAYRFARPGLQVEPTAAKILRESANIGPNDQLPMPQPLPIAPPSGQPHFGPSSGEAFDNPGLAAEQYRQYQTDPNALAQRRAGWSQAIQEGATTPQAAQGGARLASGLMRPPEASEAAAHAFIGADTALRMEQARLWNTPRLAAISPNVGHLGISVDRGVASLPQSVQRDIKGSPLQGFIDDIKSLQTGASLYDVNAFRSDILRYAKDVRRSDPALARAADKLGQIVLDSLESNPALRTNPATWADYVRARSFTRDMHEAMDQPEFQAMMKAARTGVSLGSVADRLWNTAQGFETSPGGINKIQRLLDDVRQTWGRLQMANAGVPATVDFRGATTSLAPSTAFNARVDLGQTLRDHIVSKMLDRSISVGAGVGDVDLQRLNDVHQFLRKNMDAMRRSGLFSTNQMEIADALNRASIMGQRVNNQQAPGSATYKLFQGKNYIQDLLGGTSNPLWGPLVGSALAGGLTHMFGETGLGLFLGAEAGGMVAGHIGQRVLEGRLGPIREQVIAKVKEAMDNPQLAHDLTRPVGTRISDSTRQWLRSLLAVVPSAEVGRTLPEPETVH